MKSKYYTHVKPHLEKIKRWSESGALEKRIYEALDIGRTAFYKYKSQHEELANALKKGRIHALLEVDNALFKRATGYEYEEEKTYIKKDETTGSKTTHVERAKKHMPPDVGAAHLLKKNWDKDNWANEPKLIELKKMELEIRKKMMEEKNW